MTDKIEKKNSSVLKNYMSGLLYEKLKSQQTEDLIYSYRGLEIVMENIESVIENPRKEVINIFTVGKKRPYLIPLTEKESFLTKLDKFLFIKKVLRYNYKNLHIILDNVDAVSEIAEDSKLRIYMRGSNKNYIIPLAEKESFLSFLTVCLSGKRYFFKLMEQYILNRKKI